MFNYTSSLDILGILLYDVVDVCHKEKAVRSYMSNKRGEKII